jgi:SAM-dependent methyltransferase
MQKNGSFGNALNLGTGEGDYDRMIAPYCKHLIGCDINPGDIAFAKALNEDITNLDYQVENALELSFPDNHFDLIISVEVIEHVGQPERMIEEIQRVLKPGGLLIITYPREEFPFTYDPINRVRKSLGQEKISQGAYAFGHEYLIPTKDFHQWVKKNNLEIQHNRNLSGYIIGLLEMYWTGMIQKLLKANSGNVSDQEEKKVVLRPSTEKSFLTNITDFIIAIDHFLFKKAKYSVGKGFILQKRSN